MPGFTLKSKPCDGAVNKCYQKSVCIWQIALVRFTFIVRAEDSLAF